MKKTKKQGSFGYLLSHAKIPYGFYILNLVISLLYTAVYARLPYVQGEIMTGEIMNDGLITTFIWVTIVGSVVGLATNLLTSWIDYTTDKNIRLSVWKRIIHLPLKKADEIGPSTMISRVSIDAGKVSYLFFCAFSLVTEVYYLVTAFRMLFSLSGSISIAIIVTLIPMILLAGIPSYFMRYTQDRAYTALSGYMEYLSNRLSSLKLIKASGSEEREDILNEAAAHRQYKAEVQQAGLDFLSQPLVYGMDAVVQGTILIYGGYLVSKGTLDMDSVITMFLYAASITTSCYQFVFCYQELKKAQGATSAISTIIAEEPETMERRISFAVPDSSIRFENVSFGYKQDSPVLSHLNMEIEQGKITAIVGPSGAGKTTVLRLLDRLYQPTEGRLMFGAMPAEDIHLNEWRASFGLVPQNSPLLSGSIRDNILYGVEEAVSEETLMQAVKMANVDEIADRLPEGLDTDTGDVGAKLSGGERQRIALARMMIRDPEYLLLDEATASLDAQNEHDIMENLSEMLKNRTAVVVAHTIRTIMDADRILFMENGRITASGTHEKLYKTNETYRRFVDLQEYRQEEAE